MALQKYVAVDKTSRIVQSVIMSLGELTSDAHDFVLYLGALSDDVLLLSYEKPDLTFALTPLQENPTDVFTPTEGQQVNNDVFDPVTGTWNPLPDLLTVATWNKTEFTPNGTDYVEITGLPTTPKQIYVDLPDGNEDGLGISKIGTDGIPVTEWVYVDDVESSFRITSNFPKSYTIRIETEDYTPHTMILTASDNIATAPLVVNSTTLQPNIIISENIAIDVLVVDNTNQPVIIESIAVDALNITSTTNSVGVFEGDVVGVDVLSVGTQTNTSDVRIVTSISTQTVSTNPFGVVLNESSVVNIGSEIGPDMVNTITTQPVTVFETIGVDTASVNVTQHPNDVGFFIPVDTITNLSTAYTIVLVDLTQTTTGIVTSTFNTININEGISPSQQTISITTIDPTIVSTP